MRRDCIDRNAAAILLMVLVWLGAGSEARGNEPPGPPMTIEGELAVVQEDHFDAGVSRRHYSIRDDVTGRIWSLRFDREPSLRLLSGARVKVRGRPQADDLFIDTADPGSVELTAAAAAVSGARRAVVLLVDFQDSSVACTDTTIADFMFTGDLSVDGLYQETSFGAVSFPGDTAFDGVPDVHRITIGASIADACDYRGWASLADAAAQSSGIDLSLYQHKVYIMPADTSCGWAGLASVGCGGSCWAWIRTCQYADVYAHELGHNLGMMHATTDLDNDTVIDCTYCDKSDFMGFGNVGWRQVNGPHKDQMGWIPPAGIVEVAPDTSGLYLLAPLEDDPASAPYPQLIKVAEPVTGEFYYLSYRVQAGYDATLLAQFVDRTSIHRYVGAGYEETRFIASLQDGERFEDPALGLAVTQLSHDPGAVTLQISLGTVWQNCGPCPNDPAGDVDGDGICGGVDNCPLEANPDQSDRDGDGLGDLCDGCPDDGAKPAPGACGCGTPDTDSDGDGSPDCQDLCPDDALKDDPGNCGCGVPETAGDADGDTVLDCVDNCPTLFNTGQEDADADGTGDVCEDILSRVNIDDTGSSRGRIDGSDLFPLAYAFGACTGSSAYRPEADLNPDGCVDGVDLALLASYWGEIVP